MSKTCVLIMGTNATGKTSLVKTLIAHYGGIASADNNMTSCKDSRVCFAGKYDLTKKFGGVDCLNSTKCLEDIVKQGIKKHDAVVCEGMLLHTFGLNLLRAIFAAEKQLVVFLYAPVAVINKRLLARSGRGMQSDAVWKKQKATAVSVNKFAKIGVPVLSFDTSTIGTADIASQVIDKIEQLICTK